MEISIGKLKSSAWQLFSTWKLFVKVKMIHSAECNLERCHNLRSCHEKSRTILCMILHFKMFLLFCELDCYGPMIICIHIGLA
jgi:hypothetical protein